MFACMCSCLQVEIGGHHGGMGSLYLYVGSRIKLRPLGLVGKCLYLMSHLAAQEKLFYHSQIYN